MRQFLHSTTSHYALADFFTFDIDDFSKRWIEPTISTRAA